MDKILDILKDKKVEDIVSIDMRAQSAMFDYFIIATIDSSKQSDAIVNEFKNSNVNIHHIETSHDSGWTLIDCFDTIIHLFTSQKRKEYNLEDLWKNTKKILND